jgi:hypothetical protein
MGFLKARVFVHNHMFQPLGLNLGLLVFGKFLTVFENLGAQLLGIFIIERRLSVHQVVHGTSESPHVNFTVKWHVFNLFRSLIKWCASRRFL